MDTLIHDLRYAVRMLVRSPAVSGLALLALGLGIGANTTVFSLANALLLHPLPVEEPARLVSVYGTDRKNPGFNPLSHLNWKVRYFWASGPTTAWESSKPWGERSAGTGPHPGPHAQRIQLVVVDRDRRPHVCVRRRSVHNVASSGRDHGPQGQVSMLALRMRQKDAEFYFLRQGTPEQPRRSLPGRGYQTRPRLLWTACGGRVGR